MLYSVKSPIGHGIEDLYWSISITSISIKKFKAFSHSDSAYIYRLPVPFSVTGHQHATNLWFKCLLLAPAISFLYGVAVRFTLQIDAPSRH